MENPVRIDCFLGIHNDPRIDSFSTVYSLGSFISNQLPAEHDYLYFTFFYSGAHPVQIESFYLKSCAEENEGDVIWNLDIPDDKLRGRVLQIGEKIVVGFLRDILTRKLRHINGMTNPFVFRAHCVLKDGRISASEIFSLPLNYPTSPISDIELVNYKTFFDRRVAIYNHEYKRIESKHKSLALYADMHKHLGLHKTKTGWIWREWMPAATELWLTTDALNFEITEQYRFKRVTTDGEWELILPKSAIKHGSYVELRLRSPFTGEGCVKRIPAFADWVEQDKRDENQWCARVFAPEKPYKIKYKKPKTTKFPRIYEAHVGIAQARDGRAEKSVGTYKHFTETLLPYIKECGYTAVQLMGIPEHPLYKSFGYQVSGYFAVSSRFGTPDEFKELVDTAHSLGLQVILDITHSHSAPNTEQGIAEYDTTPYFFAAKTNQWGTKSFNYNNEKTRRFLLSNCRYWLEEYHIDAFRFDAVGNMIYLDHGFGDDFNNAGLCFYNSDGRERIDEGGVLYLTLANALVKEATKGEGFTIAEEFSGMPGMTSSPSHGGIGFDYRFAMGIPDFWGKFIKEPKNVWAIWHEMTNFRSYERSVSYVASHDQSINGHDAMIWRLIGDEMYANMSVFTDSWKSSRGISVYKLMRLVTLMSAGHGYMSFMGDEFGHPEWIDAEGYGHRQWHLAKRDDLKYSGLSRFDRAALVDVVKKYEEEFSFPPRLRFLDEARCIFAFQRGKLLFVFNFHELDTASDLELWVDAGKYVEIFSTDRKQFAGNGNLEADGIEHFSEAVEHNPFQRIKVYVPPRVALIMERVL